MNAPDECERPPRRDTRQSLTGVQPCQDGCQPVFDPLFINWGLIIMEQCASLIAVSAEAEGHGPLSLFCLFHGNDQKENGQYLRKIIPEITNSVMNKGLTWVHRIA